jgi:FemAB-related protein (PEP-CTERM system-associated)
MNVTSWKDGASWDAFVHLHTGAVNYHHWHWQDVIRETYGHEPVYLAATDGDKIAGVLPLFFIRSRLFSNSLVSVPFFTYGGILCDTRAAGEALVTEAEQVAKQLGARYIELRAGGNYAPGWTDLTPKVTMVVDLPEDLDQLWTSLNAKVRKRIRYAHKNGITVDCRCGDAISGFYPIFADNMRNLGTPVYPRSWFENIHRHNHSSVRILMVFDQSRPSAAAFLIIYRDTVEMPWAASLESGRRKFTPLALYWSVIEWAHQNSFRKVDLGRCTPGSGNYDFKRHWRPTEQPLHWHCWAPAGSEVHAPRRDDAKFNLAVNVWKHLPLPVANTIGPLIVRCIP